MKPTRKPILVPAPTRTADNARWWPDLFLRKGRMLVQVSPEQAGRIMDLFRGGRGASKVRDIPLHDIDGNQIGHVSYNGRVWLHDVDGNKEVPQAGVKTAAQHEAEGWKDCLCGS